MTWTKTSDSLPESYTDVLIKWQSKSIPQFVFTAMGFYDGENWQSTSTELIVTDDLVPIEWRDLTP